MFSKEQVEFAAEVWSQSILNNYGAKINYALAIQEWESFQADKKQNLENPHIENPPKENLSLKKYPFEKTPFNESRLLHLQIQLFETLSKSAPLSAEKGEQFKQTLMKYLYEEIEKLKTQDHKTQHTITLSTIDYAPCGILLNAANCVDKSCYHYLPKNVEMVLQYNGSIILNGQVVREMDSLWVTTDSMPHSNPQVG